MTSTKLTSVGKWANFTMLILPPIKTFIALVALTLIFTVSSQAAPAVEKPTATLAVLDFKGKQQTKERWNPLIEYLNQAIPSHQFKLVAARYSELNEKVKNNAVNFVLTQPSHYKYLAFHNQLSSPLATMVNTSYLEHDSRGYSQFSGVIFTNKNRTDINQLADIKKHTIATLSKNSLGGFQMQVHEMILNKIITNSASLNLLETGTKHSLVIKAVLANQADVGFVRSGILETAYSNGLLKPSQIKIINPLNHPGFSLASSTQLYPEWPIVALNNTNKELIQDLIIALFEIEENKALTEQLKISGFTIAEDYSKISTLLNTLRLPPYNQQTPLLVDIWQHWQNAIISLILLIFGFILFFTIRLFYKNRELKKSKQQLETSTKRLNTLYLAIEQIPVRIIITDTKGIIQYVNKATIEQSGYSSEEILFKNPSLFSAGETSIETYKNLWKTIKAGETWYAEIINKHKLGSRQILKVTITPIKDANQKITGFLAIQRDVTETRKKEQQIHKLDFYDPLTGLANRKSLEQRINKEISDKLIKDLSKEKIDKYCYLVLINIDRFKLINDALGKDQGDVFLQKFANNLQQFSADEDLLARLSADEFTILTYAPNAYNDQILPKINQLFEKMKKAITVGDNQIEVEISIGIAPIYTNDISSVSDVLKHADTALHFAKSKGGNQIQLFDKSFASKAEDDFQTEQDLKEALKKNQFILHYQQQVNLAGKLIGVETLIRWQHPTKGMISPYKFITIAEKTDLIVQIGDWVLQKACQETVQSFAKGLHYNLSVNISPRQFLKNDFVDKLLTILKDTGMPAEHLTLEFTEGLFLSNMETILAKMQNLAQQGIRFSIDDFGTGYSSLAYLKKLPVNEIKIDRSFIQNIATNKSDKALVETILGIAEHMEFETVIEGVETQEQFDFFLTKENLSIQGYLNGKPAPMEEFYKKWG